MLLAQTEREAQEAWERLQGQFAALHLVVNQEKSRLTTLAEGFAARLPPECARGYMDGYAIVYQPRSRIIVDIHAVFAP